MTTELSRYDTTRHRAGDPTYIYILMSDGDMQSGLEVPVLGAKWMVLGKLIDT